MPRKNALDTRGGEGSVGAAPVESGRGGGTSTDSLPAQTFSWPSPPPNVPTSFTEGLKDCAEGRTTPQSPSQKPIALGTSAGVTWVTSPHTYSPPVNDSSPKPLPKHDVLECSWIDCPQHKHKPRKPKDTRCNITPRNATPQEAAIMAVTAPRQVPAAKPSVALATIEQQEAFAEDVIALEGICPAAKAWGLTSSGVFYHASSHPEFRKMLNAAQGAVFESQVYKLDDMCNHLLNMPPKEMNQCANAYGRVFDYRMRIVGKLLPVIYGDRPGTQVNIQNNTGIVCTEEQREKLIQMNQKLLNAGSTTTNQE